jgi:hypothetical protein
MRYVDVGYRRHEGHVDAHLCLFPYFSSSSGKARSPAEQKRLHVALLKTEKLEQPQESCFIFYNNEMTTDITWSVLAVQLEAILSVLEQAAKMC